MFRIYFYFYDDFIFALAEWGVNTFFKNYYFKVTQVDVCVCVWQLNYLSLIIKKNARTILITAISLSQNN